MSVVRFSSLTSQPSVVTWELVVSTDAKQQSGACSRKFPMCALLSPEEELFVKRRLLGCYCCVHVWVCRPIRNYSVVHPCAFVSSVWCCLLCVVSLFSPLQRSDVAVVYNQSRLCQARVIITPLSFPLFNYSLIVVRVLFDSVFLLRACWEGYIYFNSNSELLTSEFFHPQ